MVCDIYTLAPALAPALALVLSFAQVNVCGHIEPGRGAESKGEYDKVRRAVEEKGSNGGRKAYFEALWAVVDEEGDRAGARRVLSVLTHQQAVAQRW